MNAKSQRGPVSKLKMTPVGPGLVEVDLPPDLPPVARPAETGLPRAREPSCSQCGKPTNACICDRVEPADTRLRVVILQHPQEDDALLGTACLVTLTLPKAEVRTGLSWASLDHALGASGAPRDRWAVLAAAKLTESQQATLERERVLLLDRRGDPLPTAGHQLEGILVLDGTWSQAKTLWWRNPWLLKLPRLALLPRDPSMYGRLRKEPRREWVSTLEAVADVLPTLGEAEAVRVNLRRLLRVSLQRIRDRRQKPRDQRARGPVTRTPS